MSTFRPGWAFGSDVQFGQSCRMLNVRSHCARPPPEMPWPAPLNAPGSTHWQTATRQLVLHPECVAHPASPCLPCLSGCPGKHASTQATAAVARGSLGGLARARAGPAREKENHSTLGLFPRLPLTWPMLLAAGPCRAQPQPTTHLADTPCPRCAGTEVFREVRSGVLLSPCAPRLAPPQAAVASTQPMWQRCS